MPPELTSEDIPVAILAGGLATRLRPITLQVPKVMVPLAGRPFVDHLLSLLSRNGIRRVVFCLGHLGEQVEEHVGDGSRFGVQVQYSHDGKRLLGTGGALRQALPLLGDVCAVLYGDSYLDVDYRAIFEAFLADDAQGLMTVMRNDNQWDRSNVVFRGGRLLCYDKKSASAEMTHIDYGLSLLRRSALERIPADDFFDLADLFRDLVREGRMIGQEIGRRFFEIGSPRGLAETEQHLLARGA
jgi:NDP-sugar pyrophosphorylase family protein